MKYSLTLVQWYNDKQFTHLHFIMDPYQCYISANIIACHNNILYIICSGVATSNVFWPGASDLNWCLRNTQTVYKKCSNHDYNETLNRSHVYIRHDSSVGERLTWIRIHAVHVLIRHTFLVYIWYLGKVHIFLYETNISNLISLVSCVISRWWNQYIPC